MYQHPTEPVGGGFAPVPLRGTVVNRTGAALAGGIAYRLDTVANASNVLDVDTAGYAATNSTGPVVPGSAGGSSTKKSGWASIVTGSPAVLRQRHGGFFAVPTDQANAANVANDAEVEVTLFGMVRLNLDCSSANIGDPIYLSGTSGTLTLTMPTTDDDGVRQVGSVEERSANYPVCFFNGIPPMLAARREAGSPLSAAGYLPV
ncbi:MAG: hypothetical protein EKK62_09600 [Acidimicrobiia bacterium]|nr:MAG: hypothetical protein EKK62_09600 [Acidimicrobiia bacterium]